MTVNVLVSLPIRMNRSGLIFSPVLLSATPKDLTYRPLSGVQMPTLTPGTLACFMTRCTAWSIWRCTAGVSSRTASPVGDGEGWASTAVEYGSATAAPPAAGATSAPTTVATTAPLRSRLHGCVMGSLLPAEETNTAGHSRTRGHGPPRAAHRHQHRSARAHPPVGASLP